VPRFERCHLAEPLPSFEPAFVRWATDPPTLGNIVQESVGRC